MNVHWQEGGVSVVADGKLNEDWEEIEFQPLAEVKHQKTAFFVSLDKEFEENHDAIFAVSSNPFIVDVLIKGKLTRPGKLSPKPRDVVLHHYCIDKGDSVITVTLPLSKSDTVVWSYRFICDKPLAAIVVRTWTANQMLILISVFFVISFLLLFVFWENIEEKLNIEFNMNIKEKRKADVPLTID